MRPELVHQPTCFFFKRDFFIKASNMCPSCLRSVHRWKGVWGEVLLDFAEHDEDAEDQ
jgi:hypothetical protein